MLLTGEYGLRKRGPFDVAMEWAKTLDRFVEWQAPHYDEDDQLHARDWVGTGVASATARAGSDQWTAVAIVERRRLFDLDSFAKFRRDADQYMREQGASFRVLVTGRIEIAAGALLGGSVGVPGGGRGGTLGGTIAAGSDCVGLTAGHVVSEGEKGGIAEQPAPGLPGRPTEARTEIGHVIDWSKLRWRHNEADLGLIKLHPRCDNGDRSAFADLGPEGLRLLRVRKTGAATGTTVGHVTLINAKKVGVLHGVRRRFFDGLFGIEGDGDRFAWYGDSGALVFPDGGGPDGDAAIGMVVAVAATGGRDRQPLCLAVGSAAMSDTISKFLGNSARTGA
ncbi:MAG TPA: hypothetical protein VN888_20890 [Mycobacterium sp.]|nr:hypothetical protein [Mycobacterium sp.]